MKRDKPSPLAKALQKHINFWRGTQDDPYLIGNAVIAALECVKDAVIESERAAAKKGK